MPIFFAILVLLVGIAVDFVLFSIPALRREYRHGIDRPTSSQVFSPTFFLAIVVSALPAAKRSKCLRVCEQIPYLESLGVEGVELRAGWG